MERKSSRSPQGSPGQHGDCDRENPFEAAAAAAATSHDPLFAATVQACVKEDPDEPLLDSLQQQHHHHHRHHQQHQQQQHFDSAAAMYAMDQLTWDNHAFIESMSPESADLCKHLSLQLEHIQREFPGATPYPGESSRGQLNDPDEKPPPPPLPPPQQQQHHGGASSSSSSGRVAAVSTSTESDDMLKASIVAHAQYPELLSALLNIQKVGAPPERVARLDEAGQMLLRLRPGMVTSVGVNPELDDFMVAFCAMMKDFEDEFRNVLEGATTFCKSMAEQLGTLAAADIHLSSIVSSVSDPVESEERETDKELASGTEVEEDISSSEAGNDVDPLAKDENLKEYLAQRYGAYIKGLKQEFLKKKKKGKLPKHSTEKLYEWWEAHIRWPYPSEQEKAALAKDTGLDQKQINNWFINQRKRHWNPSEHDRPLTVSARGNPES